MLKKFLSAKSAFLCFATLTVVFSALFFWQTTHTDAQGNPPTWQPNTAYAVNQLVTYNNSVYRCRQAHTSLTGWEPPNVPALWELTQSNPTSVPTNTSIPTNTLPPTNTSIPTNTLPPTNTSVPTTTATNTPTRTPTNTNTPLGPPTNTPSIAAWQPNTPYAAGALVSYQGQTYRCLQAHTSLVGWEPATTLALWQVYGGGNPTQPPLTATFTRTFTPTVTPSISATPSRTFTPSPTFTASPTLPPGNTSKLLIGYWHNFINQAGGVRLRNVSADWDIVNIAFAVPVGNTGTLSFDPDPAIQSVDDFRADVAFLHSRGQKVVLSIGGAEGQVSLDNVTMRNNFITSVLNIMQNYGFDGIDIDLEGRSVALGAGDSDLRNPTSAPVVNLIYAIRQIRAQFGANFILTMAPETANVQGAFSVYGGIWGSYLPLLHATRDILTLVHVQHYNSGSMLGLDGRGYSQGTADFQVAMAEMLLYGFSAPSGSNNVFAALRPDQVAIGLPAAPGAAGGGYTSSADIERALRYLVKGQSYGGAYVLRTPAGYPAFRGLMTWSINWDVYNNRVFSTNSRTLLNSLR
ncbi:MAG TPA: glycosyl hydrolase family 18 protein [Aggregatilineales bacterium]|nr:glycosyl hydrolase family 18 protein [Aggregatilineales bacterium]